MFSQPQPMMHNRTYTMPVPAFPCMTVAPARQCQYPTYYATPMATVHMYGGGMKQSVNVTVTKPLKGVSFVVSANKSLEVSTDIADFVKKPANTSLDLERKT